MRYLDRLKPCRTATISTRSVAVATRIRCADSRLTAIVLRVTAHSLHFFGNNFRHIDFLPLRVRVAPCLQLTEEQADRIARMTTLVQESTWKIASESASELIRSGYLQQKQYLLFALCLEIFNLYFTTASTQTSPPNREEVILNKFLVSVYKHCDRQRTVQFYADEQHLSPYYFSSIIKNRSGKSALQWIESVLMLFAKHYLECTDFSIKEIADKLHFPDQSPFGRYFKHHEGLSPSDFRKENRLSLFQPLEKSKTI